MPANINFTEFTDEEVFMEDREAANTFFQSITVPNATSGSEGVVKKAATVTSLGAATLDTYTIQMLREDGTTYDTIEVCDKTQVVTAIDNIRTKVNAIILSLQNAGIMN